MIKKTQLYQDLYQNSREAMYRAMSFIEKQGGPPLSGTTKKALKAHRPQAAKWLKTQANHASINETYVEFVRIWSPIFPD
ncbi:MAG: hypothetical protein ACK4NS_03150 [Saprospiraceae bacterium]